MWANQKSFAEPAVGIIHRKACVEFNELIFNHKFLVIHQDYFVSILLLIQSNTEYGTASTIAID